MKLTTYLAAAAALSMTTAPAIAAAANPAASLSVAKSARASAPAAKKSNLQGSGIFLAIGALAIIAGGIYLAVDDNDDSDSN